MEHKNRYQNRFRNIDRDWGQLPNREREVMYRDNLRFYREHYNDPGNPSYPVPYAENPEAGEELRREELQSERNANYNDPAHYRIKRREFAHGQTGSMNPGLMKNYGDTSFLGFPSRLNLGRDYEQNVGYRENYNRLDTRPGPGYEYESVQLRRQGMGDKKGKGPRSYRRKDARILEDINDRMCDNPYLDASDIEVGVNNGEVVLTGTVEDRDSKRMAEDISEAVSGVENVENRLRVKMRGI